ncbi:MAG: FAD-binding oxidoreductase [Gammaproteobacteria bacterium]
MPAADSARFEKFAALCGEKNIIAGDVAGNKYLRDFLGQYEGRAFAVLTPETTAQVSAIIKLCGETKTPVVPQGGNTGYRGGCIPDGGGRAVILSLEKMRGAPKVCAASQTIHAAAGCVLEELQNAGAGAGFFFPLNLGAKGRCQIGGNLATNAGGLNFLRYGGARELCLGLEAVLPSGEIMDLLSAPRKNNSGYDLKNLLVGSEGTLGVITAARMKIVAPPPHRAAAFAAADDMESALALLSVCREKTGNMLECAEVMPRALLLLLQKHFPNLAPPFAAPPPLAVLVEAAGENGIGENLQNALAEAQQRGIISDAVLALSETQRRRLWELRELAPEATKREGRWLKLDVCLPLQNLAAFAAAARKMLAVADPDGVHIVSFGHLGDGNLHLSLRPQNRAPEENPAAAENIQNGVFQLVLENGGAFSAEHGIGRMHAAALRRYKNPAAYSAMRAVKTALDPGNIMNPGAVFSD